jgi:hypothetical protein
LVGELLASTSVRCVTTRRLDWLYSTVVEVSERPADAIRDHVFATVKRWMVAQEDDCTIVVVKYRGAP